MPIYEYECGSCRSRFERKQRFDEEPVAICPQCTGKAHRLIHSVPIVFKGSGFYCTDYGSKSANNSGRKSKETDTEKETKPKTEMETKPKTETETKPKEST